MQQPDPGSVLTWQPEPDAMSILVGWMSRSLGFSCYTWLRLSDLNVLVGFTSKGGSRTGCLVAGSGPGPEPDANPANVFSTDEIYLVQTRKSEKSCKQYYIGLGS